jgi:hypothetical protein
MQRKFTEQNAAAARRFVHHWQGMLDQEHTYDRRYVSELVSRVYREANFSPPRFLFFCPSPLSILWAQILAAIALRGQMGRCIRDEVLTVPLLCGIQGCNDALGVEQAKRMFDAVQKPLLPVLRTRRYAEVNFLRHYGNVVQFSTEHPPQIRQSVIDSLIQGGLSERDLPDDAFGPFPCQDIQWGPFSRYVPPLSFARRRLGLEAETETAMAAIELLEEAYAVMTYENVCLISAWPSFVHTENLFELFADGYISTFSAMDIVIKRDGVAAREALLDDF